jgi:hypothetical protein
MTSTGSAVSDYEEQHMQELENAYDGDPNDPQDDPDNDMDEKAGQDGDTDSVGDGARKDGKNSSVNENSLGGPDTPVAAAVPVSEIVGTSSGFALSSNFPLALFAKTGSNMVTASPVSSSSALTGPTVDEMKLPSSSTLMTSNSYSSNTAPSIQNLAPSISKPKRRSSGIFSALLFGQSNVQNEADQYAQSSLSEEELRLLRATQQDVADQFRYFDILEPFFEQPNSFSHHTLQISWEIRKELLEMYYGFDESFIRSILGKKITKITKDMESTADKLQLKLSSCQRQADNLKRALRVAEGEDDRERERDGKHAMLGSAYHIQQVLQISEQLAK